MQTFANIDTHYQLRRCYCAERSELQQWLHMQLRPLAISDIARALSLWHACEGIGTSEADAPEQLAAFLVRNDALSWVALAGDELVGAVLAGHDGRRGHLYHLAVRPSDRRRGAGRQLAERALSGLRAAGILKCHIMVYANNTEGQMFWTHLGWSLREDIRVCSLELVI